VLAGTLGQIFVQLFVVLLVFDDLLSLLQLPLFTSSLLLFFLAFYVSGLFASLTISPRLLLLLLGLGFLVFADKIILVAFLFFVGLAKLLTSFPGLVLLFLRHFILIAGEVIGLPSAFLFFFQSMLFSFELSTPFVVELLLLTFLWGEGSQLLIPLLTLFFGPTELFFLAFGLHEVVLSALRLSENLVAD